MIFGRRARRQAMKRLAIGSTLAAVSGYFAGILTAPKSGRETRADIKNAAKKSVNKAEQELKKLHADLEKVIDDVKSSGKQSSAKAKKELDELVDKAKVAKDKARDVLAAVRQGRADDAELNKAIKQAKTAVNNLKKYLSK